MKEIILNNLKNPAELEKLYRKDNSVFKHSFIEIYPQIKDQEIATFWYQRLNFENSISKRASNKELFIVVLASLLAGFIAKSPSIFSLNEEFFYSRNIGFIIFPILTIYFFWKNKLPIRRIVLISGLILFSLLFINFFPDVKKSDILTLSSIHIVLFLWWVLGLSFGGAQSDIVEKRLSFLRYNGDLLVITTLILIAGVIMTAITIALFSIAGIKIEEFYFKNIAILGLAAAPIIGTFLTQTNPLLVNKISPVIAKLFSPLVLLMLSIYLLVILYSDLNPYYNRDFLLTFNGLLIGVMALIFFSVAEKSFLIKSKSEIWILFALSVLTIIINSIALSAILFRISAWGFSPNRTAVMGANFLILINLSLVTLQLYKVLSGKAEIAAVGRAIALFMPIYFFWTVIVTFVFPFIFGFK